MAKNGFQIIDSDLHVMEPPDIWERYLDPRFLHRVPRREAFHKGGGDWFLDDKVFPPYSATDTYKGRYTGLQEKQLQIPAHVEAASRGFDAPSTLNAMDIEGVDVAVLYRTRAGMLAIGVDGLGPEFGFALARAYNNWLADYCKTDPSRLKGVACIPLCDIEMAVEETRRAINELGFAGITVHPEPVDGRVPYDREVDPLWAEVERLGSSIGFHGTSLAPSREDVTHKYFNHPAGGTFTHAFSFPTQLMASMGGMILSGVLERFPRLRVAFLEGNCGWVPWWLYRMDDQWKKYGAYDEGEILSMKPSDYFVRSCWISMDPDEEVAKDLIQRVGADNIILSTDYPHPDSAFPHAIDEFLELDLTDEARRKILWDNCARFYGIESLPGS